MTFVESGRREPAPARGWCAVLAGRGRVAHCAFDYPAAAGCAPHTIHGPSFEQASKVGMGRRTGEPTRRLREGTRPASEPTRQANEGTRPASEPTRRLRE